MSTDIQSNRRSQIMACAAASLIILGNFFTPVGAWTGPIMGAWFVGTQKPRRGFLWMIAFSVIPGLIFGWRKIPLSGPEPALAYLGTILVAALLGVLPFTFHRLVSPRLPGFFATLPLPLAAIAIPTLALELHIGAASAAALPAFLTFWFAATIVWLWNNESHVTDIVFGAGFVLVGAFELIHRFQLIALPVALPAGSIFGWLCLGAALLHGLWSLFRPIKYKSWANRPETVARLQSPFTGEPVRVVAEHGREALVTNSGERFPIRNGIPAFLKLEDLTGDNGKYNQLYETIAGFYDDTQRVAAALRGLDINPYFRAYMDLIEVKAGDSVLETSVGTGLSFKYLLSGIRLTGLDLSSEMLSICQANVRRWKMDADLYLGNAENLPFVDSSFDVVFTCGGFNFFSDRAKAIREMIRVTRPGGFLMIQDETEKYVKSTYEKIPFTRSYYSNRKQTVTVPIDLVPPEMENIHLEMLKDDQFYAITFRKPAAAASAASLRAPLLHALDAATTDRAPAPGLSYTERAGPAQGCVAAEGA